MSRPSVAVIVPTYNRAAHIGAALDSILSQSEPPEEVIVVDDGSTDDTLAVLAAYGNRVRVIAQANTGVSGARNAGARAARADWLTFLDSDDLWCPDRMRLLRADLAEADADVVAHVGNVVFRGVGDARDFFSVARIGVAAGRAERVARPLTMFLHAFFLIGAAFRRDVFAELGGFDTSFVVDEDTELVHRLATRGVFMVRGDVLAEVIRQPGDTGALSALRGRDPVLVNDLKKRQFSALLARCTDPRDKALASAALSDALLKRARLLRRIGQPGYWQVLWQAIRCHPFPLKILGKELMVLTGYSRQPKGVDRTG